MQSGRCALNFIQRNVRYNRNFIIKKKEVHREWDRLEHRNDYADYVTNLGWLEKLRTLSRPKCDLVKHRITKST